MLDQKIRLRLTDAKSRSIWANALSTTKRVIDWPWWKRGGPRLFLVKLTCCGRDAGTFGPTTWESADAMRESYLSGPGVRDRSDPHSSGHDRSAIIVNASGRTG